MQLLAAILITSLIVIAFFLPAKVLVRMCDGGCGSKLAPYPYTDTIIPESFHSVTERGLKLCLPDYMIWADEDEDAVVYTNDCNASEPHAEVRVEYTDVAEMFDHNAVKPEYITEGIWAFDRSVPETEYELWDFILNLTEDDYHAVWHRFLPKNARAESLYLKTVKTKNEICNKVGNVYQFENETAKGFVILNVEETHSPQLYELFLWLYDKDDLNRSCGAILVSDDFQVIKQIANSAEILPK